jgi:chemotaxis protein CheX
MIPSERDIYDLVTMIWSTTLGMEVSDQPPSRDGAWTEPSIEAQIHITGNWRGVVVLHASRQIAARAAHHMLNLGRREPTSEDIQDVFGEIANMTGGNIKGLLCDMDARLSLPSVVLGRDYTVRVPRTQQLRQVTLSCEGEPLVVTLLEAA